VPAGCQADQVSASYDAGVLTVSLPLAEAPAEPVKIPIARSGS
jgi:HSP20 family molecular chaperone IbpA